MLRLDRATHVAALSIELGIVSRELRNQLSGMSMSARLIEEAAFQESRTELVLKHAQRIQRAGVRMSRLIGEHTAVR